MTNDRSREIREKLQWLEQTRHVRILYAAESGSRAWGFASPDSDFDVRFIYVHPRESYLSIQEPQETLELPISQQLDLHGWDLRKALRLMRGSNASLFEWLQSPICYQADEAFVSDMQAAMRRYASPRALMFHYLGIAASTRKDMTGTEVKLKKYFYVLRPILAARWVVEFGEVPPMAFRSMLVLLDAGMRQLVEELLEVKESVGEPYVISRLEEIHQWAENETQWCRERAPEPSPVWPAEMLNNIFRNYLS